VSTVPSQSSAKPPAKPRLLIIDDEPLVIGMLTRLLRRRYQITTTTSSVEGLRLASDESWDAILCDVMLPELSGPQLLRRLESEGKEEAAAKMGFMTGGAFGSEASQLLASLGRGGWLAKPFGVQELEAFVERLVSRSSGDV
jgi:two-component system NtrC family sensor kinase